MQCCHIQLIIITIQWTVIKARFHLGPKCRGNNQKREKYECSARHEYWPEVTLCGWHDVKNQWQSNLISTISSNWILMSSQPHRVTSGQPNSGHKRIHISKTLLTYISILRQVSLQSNHFADIHKHQTQIFEELVPSTLPLLKEHTRLGQAGIVDHSV